MNNLDIKKLIKGKLSISMGFYWKTVIDSFRGDEMNPKKWPKIWKKVHFKTYPRFEKIILPRKLESLNKSLEETLGGRASQRNFNKSITFSQLATLVFYSAGLISPLINNFDNSRRFYPSAGARYPLEMYPIVLKSKGLEKGVYHYNVKENALEFLLKEKNLTSLMKKITSQDWVKRASVIMAISAVFKRTEIKYGDRGLRYILMEAGHLGQNLYLVASSLGLKCCAIGGYLDDEINALLDLDMQQEGVLYLFALGY